MKALLIAALAAASLSHGSMLHAQTTWQLATGYRAESFHTQNIAQFARDVEQASAGALRIDVRANNELFKLNDIRQAVQDGMRPLRLAGALRVAEGLTTLDEVLLATPPVD